MTDKQKAFVDEYLVDLNATQAYIRAYKNDNTDTSEVEGHRLLRNHKIQTLIQEKMNERSERTNITADRVLKEIAKLAFVNSKSLFDVNGNIIDIQDLDDSVTASIQSVKVSKTPNEEVIKEIKFWDKKGSLELLGKHLKLFSDRLEVDATIKVKTLEDMLEEE